MSRLKRVVIIGAGGIASKFNDALAEISGVRLVAASARTPDKAQGFLKGVVDESGRASRGYTSTAEMLKQEKPDFAIDTSPSGDHFQNILDCADLGVHLLSEKPICMTAEQVRRALAKVRDTEIKVGGIFQHRFLPCYRELRTAIAQGRFGALAAINISVPWYRGAGYFAKDAWRGKPDTDGGAIMNQGSHEVDLALWLSAAAMPNLRRGQNPIARLSSFGSNVAHGGQTSVEDTATVSVQFLNDAVGSWFFSTAANGKEEGAKSLSVFGSTGSVTISGNSVSRWDFVDELPIDQEMRSSAGLSTTGNASKDPLAIAHGPHRLNVEAFIEWLDGGTDFELDLIGAGLAPATIEAIYKSVTDGGMPVVPPSFCDFDTA